MLAQYGPDGCLRPRRDTQPRWDDHRLFSSAGDYATGNKSLNNWHGVFPDNTDVGLTQTIVETRPSVWPRVLDNPRVENIAELLQRTPGMATGIVTTVSVTDSTPAAFSSHTIRYAQSPDGFLLVVEAGSIDRQYHMMDPGRSAVETIELDKAVGVALEWEQRRGNDDTLVIVTADHETSGLAIAGFWDGSKIVYTGFPEYPDADKDGFPDTLRIDRPLIFENARTNPPAETPPTTPSRQFFEEPRNLKDLNPTSPRAQGLPDPPSANHTGTDIVISATGPGSLLFSGAIDNTTAFFNILRALGYKQR